MLLHSITNIRICTSLGADKEAKTKGEEQTPLFYAARNDATKALAVLIKNSCEYKLNRDYRGRTPLYVAAELGKDIIKSQYI